MSASCGWVPRSKKATDEAIVRVADAFKQAMAEHGIAEHPGGQCPAPDCRCSDEALCDAIEARAAEILGIDVPA